MLTYCRNLQAERDSLTRAATGITETAASESRDVTEAERASIATMAERCAAIDSQLVTFSAQLDSQRRYAELRSALEGADDPPAHGNDGGGLAVRGGAEIVDMRSWGRRFVESEQFRSYDGHGSTSPVRVPGIFTRAPIDTGSNFGFNNFPYVFTQPRPTITTPLLDAVGKVTTNSIVVQWLVEPGVYPPAEVVAEGALKPEAPIDITTATGALKTYAHYKGVTRQALADIPQIQSIIETQLQGGIFAKLEADIAAALAAAAFGSIDAPAAADGGMLAGIRQAVAMVQTQGFPNANAVLLNPADWAGLDLDVMAATNNGPTSGAPFWGLRPIASNAIPVGTQYVGDVATAVTLFEDGAASVYMSDSHADYFVRNILVILAEVMALPLVTQAGALVKVAEAVVPPGGETA